jgi:hypothetical protein
LPDLSEDRIKTYIADRLKEGAAGRTVNAELGELSRAIGRTWRELWPRVKKLEENHEVGRALSPEEEKRLLAAANANRSPNVRTMVRVSLLTGFRAGELCALTLGAGCLRPSRDDRREGQDCGGHGPTGADERRPVSSAHHARGMVHRKIRLDEAGAPRIPVGLALPERPDEAHGRTEDRLGHCANEGQSRLPLARPQAHRAPRWRKPASRDRSTMLAIMGHMSRAMLERYSHIRMTAKREAVEALNLAPKAQISKGPAKVSAKVKVSAHAN